MSDHPDRDTPARGVGENIVFADVLSTYSFVVTAVAVAVGVAFGTQYDVLDRVDLPRLPIPTDQVTTGGVITAVAVLVVTALAAMAGGTVGHRYHGKVDRHLAS